jgi:hypothetical protein
MVCFNRTPPKNHNIVVRRILTGSIEHPAMDKEVSVIDCEAVVTFSDVARRKMSRLTGHFL